MTSQQSKQPIIENGVGATKTSIVATMVTIKMLNLDFMVNISVMAEVTLRKNLC